MIEEIKILIADDHTVVRSGLKTLLELQKGFKVVGEAADGEEAIKAVARLKPDVVIMDLMMPILDGLQATNAIIRKQPQTHVLILTTYTNSEDIAKALSLGAIGALSKTATSAELSKAIRSAMESKRYISAEIRQTIETETPMKDLTEKQLDILHSVTRGLTNDNIASQFGISSNSVKKQLKKIFAKLGASNRSEAVAIALRKHLLKI